MIATDHVGMDPDRDLDHDLNPVALLQSGGRAFRPWTTEDLFRLLIGDFGALALVVTSWLEASGEVTVRHELAWLRLGIVGIGIAGFTNARWLLAGRRVVGLGRTMILPSRTDPGLGSARRTTAAEPAAFGDAVVAVAGAAGVSRYHRPDCPLVIGKTTTPSPGLGFAPCEACEP